MFDIQTRQAHFGEQRRQQHERAAAELPVGQHLAQECVARHRGEDSFEGQYDGCVGGGGVGLAHSHESEAQAWVGGEEEAGGECTAREGGTMNIRGVAVRGMKGAENRERDYRNALSAGMHCQQ